MTVDHTSKEAPRRKSNLSADGAAASRLVAVGAAGGGRRGFSTGSLARGCVAEYYRPMTTIVASCRGRIALALLVLSLPAAAQTGGISGTVKDPSDAAIAGATVVLTTQDTNARRTQTTGNTGFYSFPELPPALYRLEVEAQGFKRFVRANITVDVAHNVAIDPKLEIGQASESVNVVAETSLLETNTSSLGQVVDNREINDLPLIGRNTLALIGLTTGTTPIGDFGNIPARTNAYAQGFFSTNGSQVLSNETLIDGSPANGAVFNAPAFVPVTDAVSEFKVQTNSLAAEFGRSGGGAVNMVTKNGTNEFHGSLYDFYRTYKLDANTWFANRGGRALPFNDLKQFGGTIGGPVLLPRVYNGHNKLFFFFNYEGLRERRGVTQLTNVPTAAQLAGIFPASLPIYDPLSTRPDPSRAGQYMRDPFEGNVIPANRIDTVAAHVRNFYRAPNTGGPGANFNNFFGSGSAPNVQNQYTGRMDYFISQSKRIYGRVSWSDVQRGGVDFFGNGADWVNPGGGGVSLLFGARNASLNYTDTAAPTVLIDLRFGYVRSYLVKSPALTGIDLASLGFPASFVNSIFFDALPAFQPSGYQSLAPATSDLIHRFDNTYTYAGSVTKIHGTHTIKSGADFRFIPIGELQPNAPQGVFNFNAAFTGANPLAASTSSGSSLASFLLGYPSSGSIDYNPEVSVSSRYFAAYVQDDWKISRALTLNIGLRYEVETGRNERYNRLSWFDPGAINPIGQQVRLPNLRGGLEFAGVGGNSARQKRLDTDNFAPRLGLAWNPLAKTVVHAGAGIFYLPLTGDDTGRSLGSEGYFAATAFVSSLDGGVTPADKLSNPFPNGLNQPTGSSLGLKTLLGQDIIPVFHDDRTAYVAQWNFSVQQELPHQWLVEAAYAGSKSTRLPVDIQLNQLPDQYLALGTGLLQQVPNPFFGLITVGTLAQKTLTQGQLLRPFPEFGNVSVHAVHEGDASYHSLQLKLRRRFGHGFSMLAGYTASKLLTDAGSRLSINFANPGSQNTNNLRGEKAFSNIDVPQRFTLAYNWELPLGQGHALLGSNRVIGKIAGGWQINGVTTAQRGFPLGLGTSVNQTNSYGGGSRPNNNGTSAALSGDIESRLNRYFNTSVFSQPPAFTFGNVARDLPDVRAPGYVTFDFSVFKNTRFLERYNLQFRAEAFNALNHPNFGGPALTFGAGGFGSIGGTGAARLMQLALKVQF
jgi:hypothetical protein